MYIQLLFVFCLYFSYKDISIRKISNNSIILFAIFQLIYGFHSQCLYPTSAVIVLFVGFLFFTFNFISAGDVKLAVCFSLVLDIQYVYYAVIIMALFGGIQSVYYLFKHLVKLKLYQTSNVNAFGIPYGVAICVGFFLAVIISIFDYHK